ncbi:MAG TPA: choice-of-anchor tandem repeat GloVer-containing protein [Rhizomicrobium sp.]|jgi:uncharacterized repeat protein (TIGR03803 family)
MNYTEKERARLTVICILMLGAMAMQGEEAQAKKATESLLYSFTGGNDGSAPVGSLFRDNAGNFYGTTSAGGVGGYGTVFKLAPDGTLTTLHAFTGGKDGGEPRGGLVSDSGGNLYGVASSGGTIDAGTVFKIAPDGTFSVLHKFGKKSGDGERPMGNLVADSADTLYGTTEGGGAHQWGTVYKITPSGKESILYSFCNCSDGGGPDAGLLRDGEGNLYGTTGDNSGGTVFELTPKGVETALHTFTGDDGETPQSPLIADDLGNLYGTTFYSSNGAGLVFKLAPDGTITTLHAFDGTDGANPRGGLFMDSHGRLYGTTTTMGKNGHGNVFALGPQGKFSVVYSFRDRGYPEATLTPDPTGNLYGTAESGGANGMGSVFVLSVAQ